jgi:hypothetical protein
VSGIRRCSHFLRENACPELSFQITPTLPLL